MADNPAEMIAGGKYVLFQLGPRAENCDALGDVHTEARAARPRPSAALPSEQMMSVRKSRAAGAMFLHRRPPAHPARGAFRVRLRQAQRRWVCICGCGRQCATLVVTARE